MELLEELRGGTPESAFVQMMLEKERDRRARGDTFPEASHRTCNLFRDAATS